MRKYMYINIENRKREWEKERGRRDMLHEAEAEHRPWDVKAIFAWKEEAVQRHEPRVYFVASIC